MTQLRHVNAENISELKSNNCLSEKQKYVCFC